MIRRTKSSSPDHVKVSFSLTLDAAPDAVSVLGDFNDWDAAKHPLRKRTNGTRSVSVDLPAGTSVEFKYLTATGDWLVEPDADGTAVNEWGETNARLDL